MGSYQRTYATISLGAIKHNIATLKKINKSAKVLATIKADGYGHGAINVARATKIAVDIFGVATVKEGVHLRKNGIKKPILVLGFFDEYDFSDIIFYDLTVTIYNQHIYEKFARFLCLCQRKADIHIAVDSGMSRLGFLFDTQLANIKQVCLDPNFVLKGIFTHFACADEVVTNYSSEQLKNFLIVINSLKKYGINIPLVHTDNTAASIKGACFCSNLVRLGIGMYGINPIKSIDINLRPTMELISIIADIRLIPQDRGVSYNKTFVAKNITKVATVAIGYGDGLPRALSNKGKVIINGCFANIIGSVCMDYIMVDITDISCAKVGDKVTIIGQQSDKKITVEDIAKLSNTISYEIFTQITPRVEKIYID